MNAKGIITLTLVMIPEKKTAKFKDGKTVEYWNLTLSDEGQILFKDVTGDGSFDFSALEVGRTYCFAIVPRVKSCTAISNNGKQYNKQYNDFKIVGVYENVDINKFKELIVMN